MPKTRTTIKEHSEVSAEQLGPRSWYVFHFYSMPEATINTNVSTLNRWNLCKIKQEL